MIRNFWNFSKSSLTGIILSIVLSCLTVLSTIALMGVSAYLIILAGFHPSIALLQISIVGVRLFGISRSVFRYLERLQTHKVNFQMIGNLRLSIFTKISERFNQIVDKYSGSEILSIVINDINQMENLFVRLLSPALVAFIISILVGTYIGIYALDLLFIYIVGYTLTGFIIPYFSIKKGQISKVKLEIVQKNYQSSVINLNQFLDEAIFYQAESKLKKDVEQSIIEFEKVQTKTVVWQSVWQLLSFYSIHAIYVSILALSIHLANNGKLEIILVGVIFLVVLTSFEVLSNLPSMAYLYGDIELASSRIRDIENISIISHENFQLMDEDIFPISFKGVSYAYPNQPSQIVIQNISIELLRGDKIAIVGPNGSGKTTTIELLLGLRDDYSGNILFGNRDLKSIPKKKIRFKFGYLPANPFIFGTTVRQNLLLAKSDARDNELIQVLRSVDLFHPPDLDLDSQLDELGKNISSGEIQRLALAQSILKNSDVQIFDEPFANLDPESAYRMDKLIREKFRDKTIVFVTHRYINMEFFDNIHVMDKGKIIQNGNHEELLKQDTKYAELARISNF